MTILRYARLSDAPPPARDLLAVADDGTLSGWLSQGPLIGAYGGAVPDLARLRALVDAAGAAPVPDPGTLPLDATVESLEAGGRELRVRDGSVVDGPWGTLLDAVRALVEGELGASPRAALALEIVAPACLRLEHRGTEPLVVELGAAWAEITRWRDEAPIGDASTRSIGLGRVETGPGWSAEIPLATPEGEPGDLLTASAWFVADDAGVHVPVVLTGRATAV